MALFGNKKKSSLNRKKLDKALGGDRHMPTFPTVVMRILKKLRDPETSLAEVAEAIQLEPRITVRLIATVNSAAYGPKRPIENVQHAAAFMGRSPLEQLVLSIAVKDALPSAPAPGFEPARYWKAAAFRATLARMLAEEIHPARQAESFTVGFLQDLAVPVLATARPEEYGKVLSQWHDESSENLEQLERDSFGWSHADVGGLLGTEWELPESLVQAIERHHSDECDDQQIAPAVRLVAVLRETQAEHGVEALVSQARADYGVDPDWIQEALETAKQQAAELAALLR